MTTSALHTDSSAETASANEDERYQRRMQAKKRVVDERIANASQERGVLILLKGNGKGKSSSAFGTLARTLGHGQRAGVVQFIKGRRKTGEHLFFAEHPRVDFHVMGHGFSWETQDKAKDHIAAREAWAIAEKLLSDADYHLLVFDELSYMLKYGHLAPEEVITALQARPAHQNVIITGRTMDTTLADIADTISHIHDEKHAFRQGVKAQAGIEF